MNRFILLLFFAYTGCIPDNSNLQGSELAYVPVYASRNVVNDINVTTVKATLNAGKIYAYGAYLFQVEQYEGIHIIDNSIPKQARKIAFLKVPLCTEIAIKDNYLYTNNLNDLVVFNISNATAPQLVKRVAEVFPEVGQSYPPFSGVYFECPDPSKGIIIRWEQKSVKNPACRR